MNESSLDEETIAELRREIDELKKQYRELVWDRTAILGLPRVGVWPDIFVLMPFATKLEPIYTRHIKKIGSRLGLRVGRGDDIGGIGPIVKDVWSAIQSARVVVADCTGRNQNVCYEIGLAHAIGRQTILISQSMKDVPFELQQFRVIIYEYTPPGMQAFETAFSGAIQSVIP